MAVMQPDNNLSIKASGISRTFVQGPTSLEVLKGIDLEIEPGEMIAIIGTSGTGKTTLLQILGGLDRPTSGSILYKDQDISLKNDRQLSEFRNQSIGFVFQFHHLLPEFSALENTMIPGMIAAMEKQELLARATELLEQVGLADRFSHKVGELSGGEQQRVALARAMLMRPSLLLADEPTGNLDPTTGNKVFDLIRKMNQDQGLATVIVTHNYDLAKQMDRCLTLREGVLEETSFTKLNS
jgi:lipoprotein-releasing system ATP-binding protein